jgi:hypothetical protein
MRDASNEFSRKYLSSPGVVESTVAVVANSFVRAQESRHEADYDLASTISHVDAASEVYSIELSFLDWEKIRSEALAQDYLYALLFRDKS